MFEECLDNITKSNLSKKSIMENYQNVAMIIDEMIDEGIIINTDAESIEAKVFFRENKNTLSETTNNVASSAGGYFKSVKYNLTSFYQMQKAFFLRGWIHSILNYLEKWIKNL